MMNIFDWSEWQHQKYIHIVITQLGRGSFDFPIEGRVLTYKAIIFISVFVMESMKINWNF